MEEARSILLDRFYGDFSLFLILFILLIVILLLLITFYIIRYRRVTSKYRIGIPIVAMLLVVFTFFFGQLVVKYYNDYIYLQENDPIYVKGSVIGYAHTVSHDDLTVTKSWPIVLLEETHTELSLNIIDSDTILQIGEVYEFLYLPNTKNAEVIVNR